MKFQHMQIGQRFEYQGEVYVKSSPLVANHCESGEAKMIPRSAMLNPVDTMVSGGSESASHAMEAGAVIQAMNDFEQQCLDALRNSELDSKQQSGLEQAFSAIKLQLFNRLGLKG